MNLLRTIIERLNQRIEVANIFDKQFNLCELNANGNDKAWVHYIGNGQAEVVTNFDAKNGTLFWAKRSKVTVNKTDAYKMSGCKQLYVTSFPLTAYAIVKKSHLPCDSEDAQDWLASRIYKLTSGTDPLFKQSIGVINYEVVPSGYINEIKTLTANYEWACVSVDFDVQVITSSEDGCYDTCATGDIPLPDLQPCTPCLTEVAVDGVTIIGNGTPADPLSAVGGGGGVGTLQQVTNLGNSTTNNIAFTATAGLSFDNGAFFRKGTTDAGNGGAKGTAQICSISYELKWEAGRLYYMEQDGFTIRDVTHNFTFVPQVTDDSTKGFVSGSRWSLDDGTVYVCSDATIGAAVWAVVSVGGVTDVTGTAPIFSSGGTTPDISITQANASTDGYLTSADWTTFDGKFDVPTGTNADYLDGTGTPTLFPSIPSGTVTSVNSGININVDNTNPAAPIINSLADRYKTTSTTSNSVSNGSKNFTVDLNLSYIPLQEILIVFNPANHMHGEVTSYNAATGALVVDIKNHTGSGTYTSWVLNLDGTPVDAITGSGTANEVAYFTAARVLSSLPVATYPSLTELSYVKGVTSAIQTQINAKGSGTVTNVSGTAPIASSGGATPAISIADAAADGATKGAAAFTASDFNAASGVISIDYTNGQAASSVNKGFLTAADWTTFNNKGGGSTYKSVIDTTPVTLSILNTKVFAQLVPANTFAVGDIIQIRARISKVGTAGLTTLRVYINTADSLTVPAATLISTSTSAANAQINFGIEKNSVIKSATVTQNNSATTSGLFQEPQTSTAALTNSNIDWTVNQYIIFAIQNGAAGDSTVMSYFQITKQ